MWEFRFKIKYYCRVWDFSKKKCSW